MSGVSCVCVDFIFFNVPSIYETYRSSIFCIVLCFYIPIDILVNICLHLQCYNAILAILSLLLPWDVFVHLAVSIWFKLTTKILYDISDSEQTKMVSKYWCRDKKGET